MFFVLWPLNFYLNDNNWWLFWAHVNRTWLIQPLDSATKTTTSKSKELSIDLKDHIIDLSFLKSGNHFEPFQSSYSSQDQLYKQLFKYKVHGTVVSLPPSENTNYHLLLRENWSGCQESTKNHQKAGRQLPVFTVKCVLHQHELRSCRTRKKLLIQMQNLKAWLKFTADHMDKEKIIIRITVCIFMI